MKHLKPIRVIVFFAAVIALSRFFDAGRIIATEGTFTHVSMSLFSLFAFIFFILVLGYWVYEDEKEKNNLRVKFGPYEWMHNLLRKNQK